MTLVFTLFNLWESKETLDIIYSLASYPTNTFNMDLLALPLPIPPIIITLHFPLSPSISLYLFIYCSVEDPIAFLALDHIVS